MWRDGSTLLNSLFAIMKHKKQHMATHVYSLNLDSSNLNNNVSSGLLNSKLVSSSTLTIWYIYTCLPILFGISPQHLMLLMTFQSHYASSSQTLLFVTSHHRGSHAGVWIEWSFSSTNSSPQSIFFINNYSNNNSLKVQDHF